MCVFKGENGEVVITISTDTVIRKCLLPWQMRYKSRSADLLLVQQLVEIQKHAERGKESDGWNVMEIKIHKIDKNM